MYRKSIQAIAIVAAAVPIVALATAGTASAIPGNSTAKCDYVGGRERIKVTIHGAPGAYQIQFINGADVDVTVDPTGTTSFVFDKQTPGVHQVQVFEVALGSGGGAAGCDGSATVLPANPTLDAVDGALAAAGSSAISTDPALR
ncbi:hypothetical protein [Antrihabitans cavernicola]|uniref:Uncharacterized protein n=1 Tax=Antrihabitans cavernicola TaxID=2495913 RepID=A0A5A7SHL9_9NOCA|nr:hypothetical protein [Spelaeibacter cavernicola]KAA0024227.1 hypothetical protein FOY51_06715 [Spelaeibacter cavernicola]